MKCPIEIRMNWSFKLRLFCIFRHLFFLVLVAGTIFGLVKRHRRRISTYGPHSSFISYPSSYFPFEHLLILRVLFCYCWCCRYLNFLISFLWSHCSTGATNEDLHKRNEDELERRPYFILSLSLPLYLFFLFFLPSTSIMPSFWDSRVFAMRYECIHSIRH